MTRRFRSLRKKQMTLIEMLVVIMVLSLIVSVIGFNVYRLVGDQRFRNEVKMVLDELRLAQNLMLIMGSDVRVTFEGENGAILMKLESSKDISWLKAVHPEPKKLRVIHHASFSKELKDLSFGFEQNGIREIKFFSKGATMSSGILRLSVSSDEDTDEKNTLTRYICLSGHPEPITMQLKNCSEKNKTDADFKDQLRRITEQQIKEIGIPDEVSTPSD